MSAPEPLFNGEKLLIGMLHVPPSPGVPGFRGLEASIAHVAQEAGCLVDAGFDAMLLENFHDSPPLPASRQGPEVTAYMTRLAVEVRRLCGDGFPLGVQVLFGANLAALAIAQVADLQFVRVEGWAYGHLADKGPIFAQAGELYRARAAIGAAQVRFLADVRKKHAAHAWTGDLDLVMLAREHEALRADALILTGPRTGEPPRVEDLRAVKRAVSLPVLVGSGVTCENLPALAQDADALIVGSALKHGSDWRAPLDAARVRRLVEIFRAP